MDDQEIIAKSYDIIGNLESRLGYTIALGKMIPAQGLGVVLASIDGTAGFSYHLEAGYEFDLHIGAPGKAILAYLDEKERRSIYPQMSFKRYTPTTICSIEDYERELVEVRKIGYAIDRAEYIDGCHCVSVPVINENNRPIAALWASGPQKHLTRNVFDQVASELHEGARTLSQRLVSLQGHTANRDQIYGKVEQLQKHIDKNLHLPISIKEYAVRQYVSYSWLRRAFKDKVGQAPSQYHLNQRIQKAQELLRKTDLSIKSISEDLGFKDQNHFSSVFKRKTGISPLGYRDSV